jgi:hypothetical protein
MFFVEEGERVGKWEKRREKGGVFVFFCFAPDVRIYSEFLVFRLWGHQLDFQKN